MKMEKESMQEPTSCSLSEPEAAALEPAAAEEDTGIDSADIAKWEAEMAAIEKSLMEDANGNQYSCLMEYLADEVEDAQVQSANTEGGCPFGGAATAVENKIA